MLATLVRFAARSQHGNLEALGYIPQALDDYLGGDSAIWQLLASVRASQDDQHAPALAHDFYRRARENAARADIVVINHALLLQTFVGNAAEEPFAVRVVCDEAHTLEDAATLALERRFEERIVRRILRAIADRATGSGLVADCQRRLGMAAQTPDMLALIRAVDDAQAALDSLAMHLYRYATSKTVISQADLQRYGVRVAISGSALSAAGGPALRSAAEALEQALSTVRKALSQFITLLTGSTEDAACPAKCPSRTVAVAGSAAEYRSIHLVLVFERQHEYRTNGCIGTASTDHSDQHRRARITSSTTTSHDQRSPYQRWPTSLDTSVVAPGDGGLYLCNAYGSGTGI
jgi:Rad3-related DNA helicase